VDPHHHRQDGGDHLRAVRRAACDMETTGDVEAGDRRLVIRFGSVPASPAFRFASVAWACEGGGRLPAQAAHFNRSPQKT